MKLKIPSCNFSLVINDSAFKFVIIAFSEAKGDVKDKKWNHGPVIKKKQLIWYIRGEEEETERYGEGHVNLDHVKDQEIEQVVEESEFSHRGDVKCSEVGGKDWAEFWLWLGFEQAGHVGMGCEGSEFWRLGVW